MERPLESLTDIEREILQELRLRPNGAIIRDPELKAVVIGLCFRQLVCDPHQVGFGLFTRITAEGKAALDQHI